MATSRATLRWAVLGLAVTHGLAEQRRAERLASPPSRAGSGPVACTSHNDCLATAGHACFFNTQDKAGFCFPTAEARGGAPESTSSSFIEMSEKRQGATGATGSASGGGGSKSGGGEAKAVEGGVEGEVEGTAEEVMAKVEEGEGSGSASGSGASGSGSAAPVATPTTFGDGRLVLNAAEGQSAMLDLASGDSEFQIGNKAGNFVIASGKTGDKDRLVIDPEGNVAFNVPNVHANSLTSDSHLAVNGVPQWRVAVYDDYAAPSGSAKDGWSANALPSAADGVKSPTLPIGVSKECGVAMLGGPGIFNQAGSVSKVFNVGKDVKRVRVVGSFHFIDDWSGQSGYLKASTLEHGESGAKMGETHAVWTRQYAVVPRGAAGSQSPDKVAALNVCGNPDIGEHMFATKVDTFVPVVGGKLKLTFGSTWELQNGGTDTLPCSWGVSGLQLLIRD
jgi:hypothetical protein